MSWDQIRILQDEGVQIGSQTRTHPHMHEISITEAEEELKISNKQFIKEIGQRPELFAYPFGEYNLKQTEFIKNNFKYGFGQNSGVIDLTKNKFELPRFPINEKYGDLERFKFILKLFPIPYKSLNPKDKFVSKKQNPPTVEINFFELFASFSIFSKWLHICTCKYENHFSEYNFFSFKSILKYLNLSQSLSS